MKVEKQFQPITLTIESDDERKALLYILYNYLADKNSYACRSDPIVKHGLALIDCLK